MLRRSDLDAAVTGAFVFVFLAAVVYLGIAIVSGCAPALSQAERARTTFEVGLYTEALAECRARGKDAGSLYVYERCAEEADRRFGLDGGAP